MKICDRKFGTELTEFTQANNNGSTTTAAAPSRPDFPISLTQLYINGQFRDSTIRSVWWLQDEWLRA